MQPIAVPGTFNFRDVAGYRAAGGVIRTGKLYRSDGLHALGEAGRAVLANLGVGVVMDLRDDFEVEALPDDLDGLAIETVRHSIFGGSGDARSLHNLTLAELYADVLGTRSDALVDALRKIADTGATPVVVHCTAGKDRTGIVVALALLAVGVSRTQVVADYAASQVNLDGEWLDAMLTAIAEHGVVATPELRVLLSGSPPEVLEQALDVLERDFGSVREYLLAVGMAEAELTRLHSVLVEDRPRSEIA